MARLKKLVSVALWLATFASPLGVSIMLVTLLSHFFLAILIFVFLLTSMR